MKYEKGEGRLTLSGSTSLLAPRPAVISPIMSVTIPDYRPCLKAGVSPYGDTGILPAKLRLETGVTRYLSPENIPRGVSGLSSPLHPQSGVKGR